MKIFDIFSKFTQYPGKKYIAISLELGGILVMSISLLYDLFFEFESDLGFGLVQIAGLVLGLIAVIAAGIIDRAGSVWHRVTTVKLPSLILFIIGIILLGINLFGFLIPLRNSAVYENIPFAGKDRAAQHTAEQVYAQIHRDQPGDESRKSYVKRLTTLIYEGTVHYWEADLENDFHTQLPLHENYLLFLIHAIQDEDTQHEFCAAERAIDRCASVCSQSSRILADILSANKIPAHIITLDGHVVVRTQVEKKPAEWWILDGDYGVVIPHDMEETENNPDLIRAAYQEKNYTAGVIDMLVEIYGPAGNATIEKRVDCTREDNIYQLKWLIPGIAVLPLILFLVIEFLIQMVSRSASKRGGPDTDHM